MIYPNISAEDWLKRYPTLEMISSVCIDCNSLLEADRPYIEKDYAGLESRPCKCGSTRSRCSSSTPISKSEQASWIQLLNLYL